MLGLFPLIGAPGASRGAPPPRPSLKAGVLVSIQSRLVLSITLVLFFSLMVGSALTYKHVLDKIRTEMQAALAVGAHTAGNAVDDREEAIDPATRLRLVVDDFVGDRHLQQLFGDPMVGYWRSRCYFPLRIRRQTGFTAWSPRLASAG